jgi:hypothetical protein
VQRGSEEERNRVVVVVAACCALSTALLLLRKARDCHPDGRTNDSGQVGRNHMRRDPSVLVVLMRQPKDTVLQKTLAVSDFYFGSED